MSEQQPEQPKEECKKECKKERKCECGEVIPKRKEGEPKIKVCPKCGKDLPKKEHGFGMKCRKMRKMMKFMKFMKMMKGEGPFGPGPKCGPGFFGRPCTAPPSRGLEVHHYIHFGPPPQTPPGLCRPPMGPPGFCRPGFGRPSMGPPEFGKHHRHHKHRILFDHAFLMKVKNIKRKRKK